MTETGPAVWHVTALPLDEDPWCRFAVEAVNPDGHFRWQTVDRDEVIASLAVWLRRAAVDAASPE